MQIDSISHKALRRFAETGNSRGLDARLVERLQKMLLFLATASSTDTLQVPPNYGAHVLTGDREGTWALTVTRNWRMTFTINAGGAIENLDLEDYH
jgi:proteic killer suppression protein